MAHIARTTSIIFSLTATAAAAVGAGIVLGPDASAATDTVPGIEPHAEVEPQSAPEPAIVAAPLTEAQQELVDWAKGRFAEAGLELPELTVRFDPTKDLCGQHGGRYQHAPDGERIVTICAWEGDSFGADLERRRTLLHEFGHAWDFANLSADDREALGELLGVEEWNDHGDVWEDRGVERFAETFVYALLDQPRRQLKVDLECDELIGAFHTATSTAPLGPGVPYCAA
jgi:hypothetical protein